VTAAALAPLRTVTHTPPAERRPVEREPDAFLGTSHLRHLEGPRAEPARVCASILQVAAEGLRGLRPLSQLARWVSPEIFAELADFAPRHGERVSLRTRLEPDATASVLARCRVARVRAVRLDARTAECTALVRTAERTRAVVVRLESHRDSWRATELQAL